jgi:hypothetical protein
MRDIRREVLGARTVSIINAYRPPMAVLCSPGQRLVDLSTVLRTERRDIAVRCFLTHTI